MSTPSPQDDFLYIVAHDLGAPLRQIKGFSQILMHRLAPCIGDEERELADHLEKAVDDAQRMFEALREISYIERAHTTIEACDCRQLIQDAAAGFDGNLQLVDLPATFHADSSMLKRLLELIFDNASRFRSNERELQVKVSVTTNDGEHWWQIQDNSVGFDESELRDPTRLFKRSSSSTGIGAGLAIAEKIVQAHDGILRIESMPGNGTTVAFTLPRGYASTTEHQALAESAQQTRTEMLS